MPELQMTIELEACPVQINGSIDGHGFYFRSRWHHWEMHIYERGVVIDMHGEFFTQTPLYHRQESYGDPATFAASWMPVEDAQAIIRRCADEFASGARGDVSPPEEPKPYLVYAFAGPLARPGVTFTDEQKALIQRYTEEGDKAKAQRLILDTLNEQTKE